ncbi:hypothetical protein SAMN02745245_00213 [Anaerosphaera aminiphila DSM 21120]|uniref:DUF5317 domain-containing protein n=1 Tax=Anaerosphaera aminiphila DSM 21120 TaxID=1120995 RepID=A0A1M5P7L4_9FIRM|nr:DUF5317 domain-containing protein [Anaerosphaera aminiphila]SHG97804.1 hypothetical protein SAMN02745245_00213 [Anaerosphaera aminiphila DSM 21120]
MIIEAILIGLLLVKILGGNFTNLMEFKIKGIKVLLIGVLLNIIIYLFSSVDFGFVTKLIIDNYTVLHIFSLLFIIAGLILNYDNAGIVTIVLGLSLNIIPIILNGKMPVSKEALIATGNSKVIEIITQGRSLSHGIFNSPKALFLSDIIALKSPYSPKVISVGDIVISVGLIITIVLISRRRT